MNCCVPDYPICLPQRGIFSQVIEYKDPVTGAAINLTDYTAEMQVRESAGATDALLTLTTENGGIVINGTAGLITILVTQTQTAALPAPQSAVYDLFITSGAGTRYKILAGPVTVSKAVTR